MNPALFYAIFFSGGGYHPDIVALRKRAEADGATVGNLSCLQDMIKDSPKQDAGRIAFEAFETRALADGATVVEGRQCTIDTINELKSL